MDAFMLRSFLQKYISASVLLIIATVLALIVANTPDLKELYKELWELPVALSVGGFNLFSHNGHTMTLGAFINDFLMAIFFLSVGLEIKRELLCGELSSVKKALLPVIGACGGMLVPVIVFFLICAGDPLMERGMAIPMATDIAFSLGVLSVFSKRVPIGLKIFLAALAVADDLGGIVVIAIKYTSHLDMNAVLGAVLCVIVLGVGNWRQVRNKMFYTMVGLALWYFVLNTGIHATIAGVVLAFCVPANLTQSSTYWIEKIRTNVEKFPHIHVTKADINKPNMLSSGDIAVLKRIESASDRLISPLQDMEDSLKNPIDFFIIPLFAFANAGVDMSGMSVENLFSGVGLGVMLGLLVGKFCGVFSFSWVAIKLHIVEMPERANWSSFASVAMLCGIGFTVSMFMAGLSFPVDLEGQDPALMQALLNDAKLGILCGTVLSALVGSLMLHFTLPKHSEA